jgi:hypothetical protein
VTGLPGSPGPTLEGIWVQLGDEAREALLPHLIGETSADWLSATLCKHGHYVSASTIRTYRRALRLEGGV